MKEIVQQIVLQTQLLKARKFRLEMKRNRANGKENVAKTKCQHELKTVMEMTESLPTLEKGVNTPTTYN